MSFKVTRQGHDEAELDITAFMNLMIVLVPVLLMSLVFTRTTVLDINLPELTGGNTISGKAQAQLEVVVREQGFEVYYPSNVLIKKIPLIEQGNNLALDYHTLSLVLREVKDKLLDKRDIVLLSEGRTQYQTLVSTMDTLRSYKTVVATSLVEVELFPEISLGDAS